MRINIEINDKLMQRAKLLTGLPDQRDVVETALSTLIRVREKAQREGARGHMTWDNDADESGTQD